MNQVIYESMLAICQEGECGGHGAGVQSPAACVLAKPWVLVTDLPDTQPAATHRALPWSLTHQVPTNSFMNQRTQETRVSYNNALDSGH